MHKLAQFFVRQIKASIFESLSVTKIVSATKYGSLQKLVSATKYRSLSLVARHATLLLWIGD